MIYLHNSVEKYKFKCIRIIHSDLPRALNRTAGEDNNGDLKRVSITNGFAHNILLF